MGVIGSVLLLGGTASASWGAAGDGDAFTKATTMPTGNTPAGSVNGRNVTVSWSQSTILGDPVGTYTVRRFDASTGVAQTIRANCAGTVSGLSCKEKAVPAGSWKYAVTPVVGNWVGTEGAKSSTVTVGSPALAFTGSTTFTSLAATVNGDLTNFVTNEAVTFRLDDPSTGTVLSGSITPDPIPEDGHSSFSATIPTGVPAGVHSVYAIGASGESTASGSVTLSDTTSPAVSSAVIAKTAGGAPAYIRQGGTYYVYANVTDADVSSRTSATANVSNITTGQTAVPLVAGSYTVGGTSYNYRSGSVTADAVLGAGSKTFTIAASDNSGHSVTQGGFSVTVDNTQPNSSTIATTNVAGGTNGKAEAGDTVVYTYTEQMDSASILSGWDGTSTNVTFRLIDGGAANDSFQVWNAGNTVQLNIGNSDLQDNGYTAATVTFANSTIVQSGATLTVTLGTPSRATTTGGPTRIRWTPSSAATDRAGNASLTTVCQSANTKAF